MFVTFTVVTMIAFPPFAAFAFTFAFPLALAFPP
jgi:hypothetical protein